MRESQYIGALGTKRKRKRGNGKGVKSRSEITREEQDQRRHRRVVRRKEESLDFHKVVLRTNGDKEGEARTISFF